jgi:hypothetical protein
MESCVICKGMLESITTLDKKCKGKRVQPSRIFHNILIFAQMYTTYTMPCVLETSPKNLEM